MKLLRLFQGVLVRSFPWFKFWTFFLLGWGGGRLKEAEIYLDNTGEVLNIFWKSSRINTVYYVFDVILWKIVNVILENWACQFQFWNNLVSTEWAITTSYIPWKIILCYHWGSLFVIWFCFIKMSTRIFAWIVEFNQ